MKPLLTAEQLREGVADLARRITRQYGDAPLVIVGVLTGSVVLLADLIRRLQMPLHVGLLQAKSYRGGATSPGELAVSIDPDMLPDVAGADVLMVDDIYDTGRTLERLLEELRRRGPRSIRSAVLLKKQGRQQVAAEPDYVAFEIPDEFVVGYGLDYNGLYRNLPYLAALERQEIE